MWPMMTRAGKLKRPFVGSSNGCGGPTMRCDLGNTRCPDGGSREGQLLLLIIHIVITTTVTIQN